MQLES